MDIYSQLWILPLNSLPKYSSASKLYLCLKEKKYSMTLRIHECIWFSDDDRVILETYDECQKLDCRQNYIRNSYVFKLDPSHWLGRHGSWDTNWDSQMENIQSVKEYSGPPCLQSGILKIPKSLIMRVKFFLLF